MITAIREISYGKSPHKGLCKRCCGMMRELPPKGEVQALHRSVPTPHTPTSFRPHLHDYDSACVHIHFIVLVASVYMVTGENDNRIRIHLHLQSLTII
jgi:hypothetical protein